MLSFEVPAPIIKDGKLWRRTAVSYESLDQEHIQRLTAQREKEWQEIQDYASSKTCLMAFLRDALDDPYMEDCGQCAVCLGRSLFEAEPAHDLAAQASHFLNRSEMLVQPRTKIPANALPQYGLKGSLPAGLKAKQGRVLAHWGDPGWGKLTLEGKHSGHFHDDLVAAMSDMIQNRWQPKPEPQWIAFVPSLRNPGLVPGFAKRLADELGIPIEGAIEKVKDNEPQKNQENRFFQCRNLDGVFQVDKKKIHSGPLLLVDDVIDSRWTMTVIAALLQEAGSGEVFPVALASTSKAE